MRHFQAGCIVVLLGAVAQAVVAQPYRTTHEEPPTRELQELYEKAIYDSAIYRSANLRLLRPLSPDKDGEVLVATVSDLDGDVGSLIVSSGDGVWVTGVPEIQDQCRDFTGDVLMKLRQLLGLPPNAKVPRVLVLRVRISDVFRPAPDASVTTRSPCPPLGDVSLPSNCGNVFPSDTVSAHYAWMASQSFGLHEVPGGYPWTHLGYTYNWAPAATDRYGASEYVIRTGALALIVSNVPTLQYCAK